MNDTVPGVVKIEDQGEIKESVRRAVDGLGGIEAFVAEGERVFLKPNFNTADPYPASSSPDFIGAVADLVHEAGAGEVILGESCTYYLKTEQVMKRWGIDELTADRPWLKVIDLDKKKWVKKKVPGGKVLKSVSVPELLDRVDRLIYLPCLKTHKWARFTGALKLSVGLMACKERVALHARRLQEKIGEMNTVIQPDLVIMDARKCFVTKGPSSGEIREPGLVMASESRVAIDIEGIGVIQGFAGNDLSDIAAAELPQIKRAAEMSVDV